jgi:hypothetical protein
MDASLCMIGMVVYVERQRRNKQNVESLTTLCP